MIFTTFQLMLLVVTNWWAACSYIVFIKTPNILMVPQVLLKMDHMFTGLRQSSFMESKIHFFSGRHCLVTLPTYNVFFFLEVLLKEIAAHHIPVNQYQGQEWTLLPSILLKKIQFDRRFWKGIITSAWLIEEVVSSDHDSLSHSFSKSGVLTLWIFFTFWLFFNSSSHIGLKTTYNVLLHMAICHHMDLCSINCLVADQVCCLVV